MKVTGIVWLRSVVDKLAWKHDVTTDEVERFNRSGRFRFIEKGDVQGEDLYAVLGQTERAGTWSSISFTSQQPKH